MDGLRVLVFAVTVSIFSGPVHCQQKVLTSFSQIVSYLSNGAPVQINVNIKNCYVRFPKQLPSYSFSEYLEGALSNPATGLTFSTDTYVNGSRLGLRGPALRVFEMYMGTDGSTAFIVSDTDPVTRSVLLNTNGTISGKLGSCLTAVAGAGYGQPLTSLGLVINYLQNGYRVFVHIDIARCAEEGGRRQGDLQADKPSFSTRVANYRFSPNGSLAFSQHFPAREDGEMTVGYGDVKTNADGSTDVYYYKHKPMSKDKPKREHFSCKLGTSIFYYRQ